MATQSELWCPRQMKRTFIAFGNRAGNRGNFLDSLIREIILLPTRSDEKGILVEGSTPITILPSCHSDRNILRHA